MPPRPASPPAAVSPDRSLLAGLAAGAVAAVAASLLSLPLRSPDDAFFNTASVTIMALLAGLAAGGVWWVVSGRPRPWRVLALTMAGAFAVVAVGAALLDAAPGVPLDRIAPFVIPLAAVVFGLLALLTPLLAQPALRPMWTGPTGAAAALVLGIALAGQGDAESGRLALPELPPPAPTGTGQAAPTRAAPVATTETTPAAGPAATTAPAAAAPASDGLIRARDVAGVAFTVTPGESTATYTIREKLARLPLPSEAVGRTTSVTGTIFLDGRPSTVTVDLRTLQSDQPMRDNYVRTRGPELNRYPFAEFTVTNLVDLPSEYRPGETVTRMVTGVMKIREVERPLTFAVEARLQDDVLYVLGRTDFTWADFQIPPPNIAGIVQVEDNIHVEVLLVAKRNPQG